MKEFTFYFEGKKKGAIGCFDFYIVTVKADTQEEAHKRLYKTHDHIRMIKVRT